MKVFAFLCVVGAAFAVREPQVHNCVDRPDPGMCLAYVPSYYYDPETNTCIKFIYGGCQGNGNRYPTEEACKNHCQGASEEQAASDVCSLDKKQGMCLGYFPRFYYDRETGQCKEFIYGGCQGNGNNFQSIEDCQSTCGVQQGVLDRPDCDKGYDTGRCKAFIRRYYYDQDAGQCQVFIYGGCGGNRNNFKTEDECYNKCGALMSPTACQQEKEVGPCRAYLPRYFYNKETGQCESFVYGGCQGNDNNFQNKEDCESVCVPRAPEKCHQEPETGPCRGYFVRYYFDPKTGTCDQTFTYGGCLGNENNFETKDDCEDACMD